MADNLPCQFRFSSTCSRRDSTQFRGLNGSAVHRGLGFRLARRGCATHTGCRGRPQTVVESTLARRRDDPASDMRFLGCRERPDESAQSQLLVPDSLGLLRLHRSAASMSPCSRAQADSRCRAQVLARNVSPPDGRLRHDLRSASPTPQPKRHVRDATPARPRAHGYRAASSAPALLMRDLASGRGGMPRLVAHAIVGI
jgi:hypothetical protein